MVPEPAPEPSAAQQTGDQHPRSAPAQGAPEQLTGTVLRTQRGGQRVEQPLGDAQLLLPPPLSAAAAGSGARQAMQQRHGLDQAGDRLMPGRWPVAAGERAGGSGGGHHARMEQPSAQRPVDRSASAVSQQRQSWPANAAEQAEALHRLLTIDDRQWHALKGQACRRAAEQLAAALVQLLAADGPGAGPDSPARDRAISLSSTAVAWLDGTLRDPGCPDHGR